MNEMALPKKTRTREAIANQSRAHKSKLRRELNAVVTIAARDITIALRSPGSIIMSFAMPLILMGMLGGSLTQNMAGGLGFDYSKFMRSVCWSICSLWSRPWG